MRVLKFVAKTTLKSPLYALKAPNMIIKTTGLFTVGAFLYDQGHAYYFHNYSGVNPVNLQARYGSESYAVITGATSSTGEAFCNHLAKRGMKLILIDADQSKLDELAK